VEKAMMNSQRILTFLNANPSIFSWHISEFEAIENGVQANANNNHRLKHGTARFEN